MLDEDLELLSSESITGMIFKSYEELREEERLASIVLISVYPYTYSLICVACLPTFAKSLSSAVCCVE